MPKLRTLSARIAKATGAEKDLVNEVIVEFLSQVAGGLERGHRVAIEDFGTFTTRETAQGDRHDIAIIFRPKGRLFDWARTAESAPDPMDEPASDDDDD